MNSTGVPLHAPDAVLPTVQAVKCAKCDRLHEAAGTTYLVVSGEIIRRRTVRGQVNGDKQILGTPARPTIVCDNGRCLLALIGIEQ